MRLYATVTIGALDHPHVETMDAEADDDTPGVVVKLSDEVSLLGDRDDVVRWVQELALKVASL